MSDDVFCIIVTLTAKPDQMEPLLTMMRRTHERMRLEPTFLSATIQISEDDPNQIVLHEVWRDCRNFQEVEMHREYRQEYERHMPEMVQKPREIRYYSVLRRDYAFPDG